MEYFRRLGRFWFPDWMALVWLLMALPALYFFQTTVHEGSHAMAAFLSTGSFPKLAPFPHLNSAGTFLNGVTLGDAATTVQVTARQDCNSPVKTTFTDLAGFIATPQFVDLALIVFFSILTFATRPSNPFLRFLLRAWYLGAIVDFCYNTVRALGAGCNPGADWSRFMLTSDISPGLFALMTWIFWLAILSHFVWVYWSGWGSEAPDTTGFWDYRWVAFILGSLSLLAVLLSLTVNDAQIDKGSFAFIFFLIIQLLALAWYWIYFGLTYKYGPQSG